MNTPADLSRRNFLKLTATAAAGLAVSSFFQPAFAAHVKVKKLALDAVPADAVEIANLCKNSSFLYGTLPVSNRCQSRISKAF